MDSRRASAICRLGRYLGSFHLVSQGQNLEPQRLILLQERRERRHQPVIPSCRLTEFHPPNDEGGQIAPLKLQEANEFRPSLVIDHHSRGQIIQHLIYVNLGQRHQDLTGPWTMMLSAWARLAASRWAARRANSRARSFSACDCAFSAFVPPN